MNTIQSKYSKYVGEILHIISKDNDKNKEKNIGTVYDFELKIKEIEEYESCNFIHTIVTKINDSKFSDNIEPNAKVILHPYHMSKSDIINLDFDEYLEKCNIYLEGHVLINELTPLFLTRNVGDWNITITRKPDVDNIDISSDDWGTEIWKILNDTLFEKPTKEQSEKIKECYKKILTEISDKLKCNCI